MRKYGAAWNESGWLTELDATMLYQHIQYAISSEIGPVVPQEKAQTADEIMGGAERILNAWGKTNGN